MRFPIIKNIILIFINKTKSRYATKKQKKLKNAKVVYQFRQSELIALTIKKLPLANNLWTN